MSDDDIMRLLDFEEYEILLAILRQTLPFSIHAHNLMFNVFEWKRKVIVKEVENAEYVKLVNENLVVYVPEKGMKNGTFVCVDTTGKFHPYYVQVFSAEEECEELLKCLEQTKCIEWSKAPLIGALHDEHVEVVKNILKANKLDIVNEIPYSYYFLPRHFALFYEYEIPEDIKIFDLTAEHLSKLESEWPYKTDKSEMALKMMLELNGGIGLMNAAKEILACLVLTDRGSIGMLHVVESHRRKGYAQLLIKHFCANYMQNEEFEYYLSFIADKNTDTISLFTEKLGFEIAGTLYWIPTKVQAAS